ncbi:MAG: YlcI/YnfO family protein [Pseudomonadota bacterium]
MARLTLRLPNSLHEAIARRADAEGVSINQLVVYALTRDLAVQSVEEQRARFEALRTRYPREEAEAALTELLADRHA